MAFVKGQSGNPGGRPKAVMPDGRTLSEAAREHSPEALRVLVEALSDPSTALAAAKEILDRGFGRAPQSVELAGPEGGAIPLEHFNAAGLSAAALREIAALDTTNAE